MNTINNSQTLKIIKETKNIYPIGTNCANDKLALWNDPVDYQFSETMAQLRDGIVLRDSAYGEGNWLNLLLDFKKFGKIKTTGLRFDNIGTANWNHRCAEFVLIHLNNLLATYGANVFNNYLQYAYGINKKSA